MNRPAIIKSDHALIPLGKDAKGGYAKVDLDFIFLEKYNWSKHYTGNAQARVNNKTVCMENFIVKKQHGQMIDHINHDRADNRSSNLRLCTQKENRRNCVKSIKNTTGYKGVVKYSYGSGYRAQIGFEGKKIHIGIFKTAVEAAQAYDKKAKELFSNFAYLNFKEIKE